MDKTTSELARERLNAPVPRDMKGLRRRREHNDGNLMEPCENCKCRRYNPCTCMRKGEKE